MSDIHDDDEPRDIPQLREAYERATKRATEAEAKLAASAQLERQNLMLRAGVDVDSPIGELFANGYRGDLELDAVKTAWTLISPATDNLPVPVEDKLPATTAERESQQVRDALATGGLPPGEQPPGDPWDEGYAAFHTARAKGARREDAATEVLDRVFDAAGRGDPRVLYQGRRR